MVTLTVTSLPNRGRVPGLTKHQRRTLMRYARKLHRRGNHLFASLCYAAAGCSYTRVTDRGPIVRLREV